MARKAKPLDDVEPPKKKAGKPPSASAAEPPPSSAKKKNAKPTVPEAGDYLRLLRGMKDVTEEDYAFFDDPLAWTSTVTEWVPTGSLAIDRLIGGGWPIGRVVEVAAWESVGKSTLIDQSIAMAQSLDDVCVLIDSEQARDEKYSTSLGVDAGKLIVHKAETIEDAFLGIDRVLALQEAQIQLLAKVGLRPPRMLIFWDSLGGTPTRGERDGSADESHVSEAARSIKMNMRRLAQRIAKARAVLIFSNQFYENIGGYGGLKSYGGSGIRYFASLRLWLTKKNGLKVGDGVVGHIIEAKLKKTRVSIPKPPCELGLIYGAGIHNAWTLWEWGKKNGVGPGHKWCEQAGAWSYLVYPPGSGLVSANGQPYETFQRTFLGFAEQLAAHPDVYRHMAAGYMAEQVAAGAAED